MLVLLVHVFTNDLTMLDFRFQFLQTPMY